MIISAVPPPPPKRKKRKEKSSMGLFTVSKVRHVEYLWRAGAADKGYAGVNPARFTPAGARHHRRRRPAASGRAASLMSGGTSET